MKQTEKSRRSRECILAHAFAEFAANGYLGSSLNQICARGNISKGLLYHYYADKDALYLACVEKLFRDMTGFLQERLSSSGVTVEQYFSQRMRFFQQNPEHQRLFYDILMYPQSHLAQDIAQCRADFDAFNDEAVRTVLSGERLAEGLSMDEALRQFRAFVNLLGVCVRADSAADAEQEARALLHTMLYGMIAR